MIEVAAISDLHGELPPFRDDVDLHVIAGDVCPMRESHDPFKQANWIQTKFAEWVNTCPTDLVWIGGNHDFVCDRFGNPQINNWVGGGKYLHHARLRWQRSGKFDDAHIRIWGMPFVLGLEGWAFNLKEGQMQAALDMVPADTQLLICHNPPRGVLDKPMFTHAREMPHVGSVPLTRRLLDAPGALQVVVCGHIHEGKGSAKINNVQVYNVAYLDREYEPYVEGEDAWTKFTIKN